MLSNLAEWVTDVIDAIGYVGVALLVAIENVFPPIPSEVVLPFAGFVASDGDANLVLMIVAATVGSMAGAYLLYGISAWVGEERLHYVIARFGKWARLSVADVEKAERWFDRRGSLAVLFGRCVPLIRSLVSIPAGFGKMPLGTFSLFTLIGSVVWNTALIGAGYLLRDQWEDVEPIMEKFQYLVIAAFLVAGLLYLWVKFLSPQARSGETRERTRDEQVIAEWNAKHGKA